MTQVLKRQRYVFGWVDPRGIFNSVPEAPLRQRIIRTEGQVEAFYGNRYIHGVTEDTQG